MTKVENMLTQMAQRLMEGPSNICGKTPCLQQRYELCKYMDSLSYPVDRSQLNVIKVSTYQHVLEQQEREKALFAELAKMKDLNVDIAYQLLSIVDDTSETGKRQKDLLKKELVVAKVAEQFESAREKYANQADMILELQEAARAQSQLNEKQEQKIADLMNELKQKQSKFEEEKEQFVERMSITAQENQELKQEIEAVQTQLKQKLVLHEVDLERIRQVEAENKQLFKQIQELQTIHKQQLEGQESKIMDLTKVNQVLKQQNTSLQAAVKDLQEDSFAKGAKIDSLVQKQSYSEQKIAELQNNLQQISKMKEQNYQQSLEMQARVKQLESDLEDMQLNLEKQKSENQQLQRENETLKRQIEEHTEHIQNIQQEKSIFQAEIRNFCAEKGSQSSEIGSLKSQNLLLSAQIEKLQQQNQDAENLRQTQFAEATQKYQQVLRGKDEEIQLISAESAAFQAQTAQLNEENELKQTQISELSGQIERQNEYTDLLKAQAAQINEVNARYSVQLTDLTDEIQKQAQIKTNTQNQYQADELPRKIAQQKEETDLLNAQLAQINEEKQAQIVELQRLYDFEREKNELEAAQLSESVNMSCKDAQMSKQMLKQRGMQIEQEFRVREDDYIIKLKELTETVIVKSDEISVLNDTLDLLKERCSFLEEQVKTQDAQNTKHLQEEKV